MRLSTFTPQWKGTLLFLSLAALLCCSCSKEEDEPRPHVVLKSVELTDSRNLTFRMLYKLSVNLPEAGGPYRSEDISFSGEAVNEQETILDNKKLKNDLRQIYIEAGIDADTVITGYLQNRFTSIRITCDKLYREAAPGESLNGYFAILGGFVYQKGNRYHLTRGDDMLNSSILRMEDLLFPNGFHVEIRQPPFKADRYTFYIELTDLNGRSYKAELGTVDLIAD